jgi:hypothetical protein
VTPDSLIAAPGDKDLDLHVSGLTIAGLIISQDSPGSAEVIVSYDVSRVTGFWRDPDGDADSRFCPDAMESAESCFGIRMLPGQEHLLSIMLGRLERWRDHGTPLEMTAAPGKWTLLRGPDPGTGGTVDVVHPRTGGGSGDDPPAAAAGVTDTGRYIDPLGHVTTDPYGGGQPDGIRLLIKPDGWRGWFYGICPGCGQRFRLGLWCWTGYSGHYAAAHLRVALWRRPG